MMLARQIMRQPVHTVHSAESVARAVLLMQMRSVSCLLVQPCFEGDEYGIITKADVIAKVVARGRNPLQVRVAEVMTESLRTINPDCPVRECATLMMRYHIRRLPVFVDGQPLGIVSDSDVFDSLLNFHAEIAVSISL